MWDLQIRFFQMQGWLTSQKSIKTAKEVPFPTLQFPNINTHCTCSVLCDVLASVPALCFLGVVFLIASRSNHHVASCPQCKEGGFPQELWLGVSADAVSVYKRGEGRPLEVFQYEHILSFGAPLANTYKIVVDERELLFETSEVRGKPFVAFSTQKNDTPFPEGFDPVILSEYFV